MKVSNAIYSGGSNNIIAGRSIAPWDTYLRRHPGRIGTERLSIDLSVGFNVHAAAV